MGAGALCRLLADTPGRFERIVLYLPAPLDGVRPAVARERLERLLAAVDSGEAAAVAEAVEYELPPSVRNTPTGWSHLRRRVEQLLEHPVAAQLDTLWQEPAVPDVEALRAFTGRALVLGCLGDDLHPVAVAERLAELLPAAELHVYDRPAVLFTHRGELRERISAFLNT
jgi:pimeloyl-ACP methyl ester carboxylesterase